MPPLPLSPLPSVRPDENSDSLRIEQEGLVDEDVVTALVNSPLHIRASPAPPEPPIPMDEEDFAGWKPVTPPPAAIPAAPPPSPTPRPVAAVETPVKPSPAPAVAAQIRRAAPPRIESPSETEPPRPESGGWWLACLAGILTAAAICLVLYYLLNGAHPAGPPDSPLPGVAKPPLTPPR